MTVNAAPMYDHNIIIHVRVYTYLYVNHAKQAECKYCTRHYTSSMHIVLQYMVPGTVLRSIGHLLQRTTVVCILVPWNRFKYWR